MSLFGNLKGFAAVAALVAGIGFAVTPAHAVIGHNALLYNALVPNALVPNALASNSLIQNSLTYNALGAGGSAIGDLNGVAVESVTLP